MSKLILSMIATSLLAGTALAAERELTFGLGYAKLGMPANKENNLDGRDGMRFDLRFTGPVSDDLEQLRLGGGFTMSGYSRWQDDEAFVIIDDEIFVISADSFESVSMFIPEFIVSWQQPLGDGGWFVEPGLATGLMIGTYSTGNAIFWGWAYDDFETDISASIRPHVRVGFTDSDGFGTGGWVLGGELSYLWGGRLDFGDAGDSDIQEFYLGFFAGTRF